MRWVAGAAALALAAAVGVNVLLLFYGGDRHDPVGKLSPVITRPVAPSPPAAPAQEDD